MQALSFPRGNYYQIICKATDKALQVQERDPAKSDKSRIIAADPNPNDSNQIFMIEKVTADEAGFEIVSCPNALVFDEEGGEIRLKVGKQKDDQLFKVTLCPAKEFYTYYWIQTSKKGDKALSLESILRYENFDSNKESQLFRFEQIANNNNTVASSAVIINNGSGKALDVPEATHKKGVRLVQWEKNKRWNQRWRFIKEGKGVAIQSVINGLVLDIAEEKRDSGAKVVQWERTGGSNQQWFPEQAGNGIYKFRSCHEPSLFLGIKKASTKDGGELQVCSQENTSIYWRLEGALP